MAIPSIMIGMMKCKVGSTECGSVKSASVTVKPNYKEHKTGYPQVSDLKALMYAEGICKVDSEESILMSDAKNIALGISSGTPACLSFEGNAPGLGGTALTITGDGFGSSAGLFGKMEDFGYITAEVTCLDLQFVGGDGAASGSGCANLPFIVPDSASQAITTNSNLLLYGAPTVDGSLCVQAQFNAACKMKYLCMSWPPTIDAVIMESSEFSISASFADGNSSTLTEAASNMTQGTVAESINRTMSVPTVGGATVSISLKAIAEADISFSPGNDWNGISVKLSALLTNPSDIGTNWAGIA